MTRVWRFGVSLVLLNSCTSVESDRGVQVSSDEANVPVYCRALEIESRPRSGAADAPSGLPELVVIGRFEGRRDGIGSVRIEKVLFGGSKNPVVSCPFWHDPGSERQIFAFVTSRNGQTLDFLYTLPPSEERAEAAICRAVLESRALAAEAVVVAKAAGPGTLLVEHSLRGVFSEGDAIPLDDRREAPVESAICFLSSHRHWKTRKMIHMIRYVQPTDRMPDVIKALRSHADHPLIRPDKQGGDPIHREILLRGSPADAIDLLGSASEAAVCLAARYLIHHKAVAEVRDAIEKDLYRSVRGVPDEYRRLHNLVRVLGELHAVDVVDDLLRRFLDHIETGAPEPPEIQARDAYWTREENREDSNHVLVWLLQTVEENHLIQRHAGRLLGLRDRAKGRWREELQLAVDVCRLEDTLEVRDAMKRSLAAKRIRSSSGFRHTGQGLISHLDLSRDGKLIALGGSTGAIEVFSLQDGSRLSTFTQPGSIDRLRFAPDGASLILGGYLSGKPIHARVDWRSGKVEQTFSGHDDPVTSLDVSNDGMRMVSASYYDDSLLLWDVRTAKVMRRAALTLWDMHPDGKTLVRRGDPDVLNVETFEGEKRHSIALAPGGKPLAMTHSPDGRWFITSSVSGNDGTTRLSIHDASKDYAAVRTADIQDLDCALLAIAPDGRYLVAGGKGVWVLSLPDFKVIKQIVFSMRSDDKVEQVQFSRDGAFVAIVNDFWAAPRFFSMATLDEIYLVPGHAGYVTHIFFVPGTETLRTAASDNTVCTWDATTMRMRSRTSMPPGFKIMSLRPSDGRYAVCYEAAVENRSATEGWDKSYPAKVVDCQSGEIVSTPTLPVGRFDTQFAWLDNKEALVITGKHFCRFSYLTGELIEDRNPNDRGSGELNEDHTHLFSIHGDFRSRRLEVQTFDLRTMAEKTVGEIPLKAPTGGARGLVPGGRYCYVGDPGMSIYDRQSLAPVAEKSLAQRDILGVAFSGDGSRYAVATGGRIYSEDLFRYHDPKLETVIRVVDTLKGNTLAAFPPSTRWIRALTLSPAGDRVAFANADGTIEVWTLP